MDLDDSMTGSTTSSTPGTTSAAATNEFDNDDLFPESQSITIPRPHTPTPAQLSVTAAGELSPPRSVTVPKQTSSQAYTLNQAHPSTQANTHSRITRSINGTTGFNPMGKQQPSTNAAVGNMDGDMAELQQHGQSQQQPQDEKPGWGWKNKKAQEDIQRAWESVVDRDFSLREFGDVVMLGKQQLQQMAQHQSMRP